MNFNDIFKSNFLQNVTVVSVMDMVLAITLAFCMGIFIFFVYKRTFRGVMYSSSFGITLIAITMISTLVILAVTSNVVLSLGMVGALSIVRFRTAIKEPLDIAFLFWSIAAGIVLAAGMIPLAIFGSVMIGLVLMIFVNKKTYDNPYILVVNCAKEVSVGEYVDKSVLKSKTVTADNIELNYEVRLKNENTDFVNELSELPDVNNVVLVSYNGDYMG
ncbi:MAG: DUF4956 domain-containing protein [Clostridiales bacterium]|jgi:uncharacterized membrane protein YhiD involved in acid resistance|nr:DUF4956 domain-containing protein [Clostridiales bacterium]